MAKKSQAEAVETEANEVDYTKYLDKAPTDLQERFAEWIKEQTGIEFANSKLESAFDEGVRLGVALRMPFQRSPENQAVLNAKREATDSEPESKPAKKSKKTKAQAQPEADTDDDGTADSQLEAPRKRKAVKKAVRKPAAEVEETEAEPERPAKRTGRKAAKRSAGTDAAF